jgi:hypothetical protein
MSGYWEHYNATHPSSRDDGDKEKKEGKDDRLGSLFLSFKNMEHENTNFRRNDFDPSENNNARANDEPDDDPPDLD